MAPPKPRTGCSDAVRLILQSTKRPMTVLDIQAALPTRSPRQITNALNSMMRHGEVQPRRLKGGLGGCRIAWEWADGVRVAPQPKCLLAQVWR